MIKTGLRFRKDMICKLKSWGQEIWLVNDNLYCSKILEINQDKSSSCHCHWIKTESLYLLEGSVTLYLNAITRCKTGGLNSESRKYLENSICVGWRDVIVLEPGNIVDINPRTFHRFVGRDGFSRILEVSTTHYEEDSIRIPEEHVV